LSNAAAAGVTSLLTTLSAVAWTSAVVWHLADASTLEAGADFVGLDAATGDELSAVFDVGLDVDDLQW